MEAVVINTESLPDFIRDKLHVSKVSVLEHDGGVILMPVREINNNLWGLLADSKFTSNKFLEQKRKDKELEI